MLKAEVEKPGCCRIYTWRFPRTDAQAKALDQFRKQSTEVSGIALEVDDEVLVERLLERGKSSGRPDDEWRGHGTY
jgi:adenylate kinase